MFIASRHAKKYFGTPMNDIEYNMLVKRTFSLIQDIKYDIRERVTTFDVLQEKDPVKKVEPYHRSHFFDGDIDDSRFSIELANSIPTPSNELSRRVLRRLGRVSSGVGWGLALLVKSISGAGAQTPPENQLSYEQLPIELDMKPGDYRVFNESYDTFVYNSELPFEGASVTFRGSTGNVSMALALGASFVYGTNTTSDYRDIEGMVVANVGKDSNGNQKFLLSPTFSSQLLTVFADAKSLGQFNMTNMSSIDPKINETIIKIDLNIEDAKRSLDMTRYLVAEAANLGTDPRDFNNTQRDALNFVLSADNIFGKEFRLYQHYNLEQSPFLNTVAEVHDVGLGSVKDDIVSRNATDLDHLHSKAMLYFDLCDGLNGRLDAIDSQFGLVRKALERNDTKNATVIMDNLLKLLDSDYDLKVTYAAAIERFQQREAGIGALPFQENLTARAAREAEDERKRQLGAEPQEFRHPIPVDSIIPVAGLITAAALASMRKKKN